MALTDDISLTFGERLRVQRRRRKLSQRQVAAHLKVSRPTVTNWESGRTVPDAIQLFELARLLETDVMWFDISPLTELVLAA